MRKPDLEPKNLPKSRLVDASYCKSSSRERSLTLLSKPPKPMPLYKPVAFKVPRSANFIFRLPVAAVPERLSKSVSLNSLNQSSPHFSSPSSELPDSLRGLRTPSITVWTWLRLGLPKMVTRCPDAVVIRKGMLSGQFWRFLSFLASLRSVK